MSVSVTLLKKTGSGLQVVNLKLDFQNNHKPGQWEPSQPFDCLIINSCSWKVKGLGSISKTCEKKDVKFLTQSNILLQLLVLVILFLIIISLECGL